MEEEEEGGDEEEVDSFLETAATGEGDGGGAVFPSISRSSSSFR